MSNKEADRKDQRQTARNPEDYPGYPPKEVREGIRKWGSSDDWDLWRKWEEFIRGESDKEPASLAEWLPNHELVALERRREEEEAAHRLKVKLNRRAEFVMGEQIAALRHALGRGYIRSPLKFAYEGYPGENERSGPSKSRGMWGNAAWKQKDEKYVKAWDEFMRGRTDEPPAPRKRHPAGWAIELENKGYIGNDPPSPMLDPWLKDEKPESSGGTGPGRADTESTADE